MMTVLASRPAGLSNDPPEALHTPGFGALVISLDFELHWGVRDHAPATGAYRRNLLGVREAVPRTLDLFTEFDVAATWATVGFLFASSREELEVFSPAIRPAYRDARLFPYAEPVGENETDDPFHFAPSLIQKIRSTPRQEIATHTFSHYYCLEPDRSRAAFEADLDSARAIARAQGLQLRSIVFPRNQHNAEYESVLTEAGIVCFRGNQRAWMHQTTSGHPPTRVRAARLADAYLGFAGPHTTRWSEVPHGKLCNVPASFFLRAFSPRLRALEPLRFRRIARSIRRAAAAHELVHLWWHPHNFGTHLEENLRFLRQVLTVFAECRASHGMRSLSMHEAAAVAAAPVERPV